MEQVWFLVDYYLPTLSHAERKRFYRAVHKLLGKDVEFASYSCYTTRAEKIAASFYEIAKQHGKHTHLYKGVKVQ